MIEHDQEKFVIGNGFYVLSLEFGGKSKKIKS